MVILFFAYSIIDISFINSKLVIFFAFELHLLFEIMDEKIFRCSFSYLRIFTIFFCFMNSEIEITP